MTLSQIVQRASKRLNDVLPTGVNASKKGWKAADLCEFADEAESEVARRLRLLEAHDIIGYITLDGTASGQITSVSVSGVTITSAAVLYATSMAHTATLLAANISAYTSTPNYRAQARGPVVIIKAVPGTGFPTAGYSLAAVTSGGITATATDTPGLCRHVIAIGGRFVDLHTRLWRITRFKPSTQSRPIGIYTRDEMDNDYSDWENADNGTIARVIPDYESHEAIVYPPTDAVIMVEQSGYRLPLIPLTSADMQALPEIGEKYHLAMVHSIVRQACLKPDVETWYKELARQAEADFEAEIEKWKIELIHRDPSDRVNKIPAGLM